MHFFIFIFVGLTIKQSQSKPTVTRSEFEEQDIGQIKRAISGFEERDIFQINRELGLNFSEGDILRSETRSAISVSLYLWEMPVPYTLDVGLDINAKGVILQALEQFRLKSCIDFKVQDTEEHYITFIQHKGCYSRVGKAYMGSQHLSIGKHCDTLGIVEHEILHALGFLHEQSRYDRDDHVTIVWENIEGGLEFNFLKMPENFTTTQGIPYDYDSVMHYGQYDFTNGEGKTIVTKLPEFQNRIGQRFGMSHYDLVELNGLYNCTSSLALLERCSFQNETCQLSRCSRSNASWSSETFAPGGPPSGHTDLGYSGEPTPVPSNESSTPAPSTDVFMHFSTANGVEGDRAKMETRKMTPRRPCTVQCLQFFYYHSGNESDQLNIWIREFDDDYDTGTRRLMWQITGPPANYWQLQHVPLNATKMFQVEFEGRKGNGSSFGGFSIDDINLSETECPHQTWHIRNVEQQIVYTDIYSPRYFSRNGYGYQILLYRTRSNYGVYARLVSGENDDQLQWPCPWHQITIKMLDQNPDIQQRMSKQMSLTTDPFSTISYVWDKPRENGHFFVDPYGEAYFANIEMGQYYFISLEEMKDKGFIKEGDIFLLIYMQDISELRTCGGSLKCNTMLPPQKFSSDLADDGPCVPSTRPNPITIVNTMMEASLSTTVSSSVIIILMALVLLWSH